MDNVKTEDSNTAGSQAHYFLLTIDIVVDRSTDVSLLGIVRRLTCILQSAPLGTTCLYKFKVTAEPKLIAVFEVKNIFDLEIISAQLMRYGRSKVTCDPLIEVERTRNLQVQETPFALLCVIEQEHHGITTNQPTEIQQEEHRTQGPDLEVFRVAGKRTVYMFVGVRGERFDDMISRLPVIRQNGQNTHMSSKSIQSLDQYVQQMIQVQSRSGDLEL